MKDLTAMMFFSFYKSTCHTSIGLLLQNKNGMNLADLKKTTVHQLNPVLIFVFFFFSDEAVFVGIK